MNDTNNDRKEPNGREITYQIGWKRGTIREQGRSEGTVPGSPGLLEKAIWRPLPGIPAKWMTVLLWAVPVVGFAVTYMLVTALMRVQ